MREALTATSPNSAEAAGGPDVYDLVPGVPASGFDVHRIADRLRSLVT